MQGSPIPVCLFFLEGGGRVGVGVCSNMREIRFWLYNESADV